MKLKHLYEAMALKKQDNVTKHSNSENVEIIKNLNLMIIPYFVIYKIFAFSTASKTVEMPPNLLNFITTHKTSSDGQKNTEMLKQLANNDQFNDYFDEILSDNISGFKSFKNFNIPNLKGYTDWYIPSETEALNILLETKNIKTKGIGTSNLFLKTNNSAYEHPKKFIYQINIVNGSTPKVVKDHGQTTFVISHLIRKI